MKKRTYALALLSVLTPAALTGVVSLAGCANDTGGGAQALDSTTHRGQGVLTQPAAPAPATLPSFPGAFIPARFAASPPTGQLIFNFDGDVAGQGNTTFIPGQTNPCGEPLLIALQTILTQGGMRLADGTSLLADGSHFLSGGTPNPALISGRGNIDIDLQLAGLPTASGGDVIDPAIPAVPDQVHPNPTGGQPATIGYSLDVPPAQAASDEADNSMYWARVSPGPGDPTVVADNRPFRVNHIVNGWLQPWLMGIVPVGDTTNSAPGIVPGIRGPLALFYRRRAEGANPAGSLRGFTAPNGTNPAGVQPDDIRLGLPGPHPLTGVQLPGAIRMIALPAFRPNTDGTAHVRAVILGERATDPAITGGAEIAIAPRNVLTPTADPANLQVILLRTVPASEDNQPALAQSLLAGARLFGIPVTLEPSEADGSQEIGINQALRNPIDLFVMRPVQSFDFNSPLTTDPCLGSSPGPPSGVLSGSRSASRAAARKG